MTTTTAVRTEAVPWAHADAATLREQMTAELRPALPVQQFGQYVDDPYSLCFAKDLA